ncbi:MAG: ABC transporter permease [Prevotella sp.]|nr:ABC transporter permease [Prevotella sp.]
MVFLPLLSIVFFTSMLDEGLPQEMPVGVVDLDNTTTSRSIIHNLDAFQTTQVVAHYPSMTDAREAVQNNEIYAFLYIPKGTTDELLSSRQPKISFYYSMTSVMSGSLLFRDLKTIATLGSASVGQATMRARGYTNDQIRAFLQPVVIDLHQLQNPWTNYNVYLSTMLIPGVLMLFISLITAYSLGTELKFGRSKNWMHLSGDNVVVALIGKMLPQTLIFFLIAAGYSCYVFGVLGFPHPGGWGKILLLTIEMVWAAQGFGIFIFGLVPSLRMSMSICSLWGVLSFSMCGAAFPVIGMDAPLQSLSWLFPLRHYYMVYQQCVLNGFPLIDAWFHFAALSAFSLLPLTLLPKIKNAMLNYVYIP